MSSDDDDDEEEEEMSRADRIGWHLINAFLGLFVGIFAFMVAEENDLSLHGQYAVGLVAFGLWVAVGIGLARIGVWDFLTYLLAMIFWPIGKLFELTVHGLAFVFQLLGRLLGILLVIALIAFIILGVAGLLWFGIQQLFL